MPETTPDGFLAACSLDSSVLALRPDYRAMLLVVDGLEPGGAEGEGSMPGEGSAMIDDLVALTDTTRTALFILDALEPMGDAALDSAADALTDALAAIGDGATVARRRVGAA